MGEYRLLLFWRCQKLKFYGTLKFLTQDHMGLGNSKRRWSFHPMSVKLYEGFGYHGGTQAITFLGNGPSFKHFVVLWNFNMGVNGKKLRCEISRKRLIVERNGRKIDTRGNTVHACRVLLMPDSLKLVWGHSVQFSKFPILQFSKYYSFNSFHLVSTKLHTKYNNRGLI